MMESYSNVEEAQTASKALFRKLGSIKSPGARPVNRFFIQLDRQKQEAKLMIGNIGGLLQKSGDTDVWEPFADVSEVFTVDTNLLRSLVEVINDLLPPDQPKEEAASNE